MADESTSTFDVTDHLMLALAAGEIGTWRVDNTTGRVSVDDQLARLFGVTTEAFDGTFDGLLHFVHPEDAARLRSIGVAVRLARVPFETEYRVVWPDGSVHWLRGKGKVLIAEDGTVVGTVGCVADVTDRKLLDAANAARATEAERSAAEERLQRARLEFITAIDDAVLLASDHRDLMRRVASAAVPRLGDWCSVHFIPGDASTHTVEVAHADPAKREWALELQARYPYDPDAATGVPAVIRTGRTEFVPQIDAEVVESAIEASNVATKDDLRAAMSALQLTSAITVPLRSSSGVIGALQFISAESGRVYDNTDVALAQITASRMAAALDGTWQREQHRQIASTLQSALLPDTVPDVPGASVAVRYWATGRLTEVGGDFYDLFEIAPNRWGVVIGDVCGTGPSAAAVIAAARHTIRAAAVHGAGHREVLEWVNDAVLAGQQDRFCTAFYATLERLDDGTFRFEGVAGGHPLPFVVRANGSIETLGRTGTLLGEFPDITLRVASDRLGGGDTLVMYTDGISDVPPPHHLDRDALAHLVRVAASAGSDADDVAERLRDAIESILPIADRDDDIALVVVRVGT